MLDRVNIHLSVSGTIALSALAQIAALVQPDDFLNPAPGSGNPPPPPPLPPVNTGGPSASVDTAGSPANITSATEAATSSVGGTTSETATSGASPSSAEVDAAGTPFDSERHTGTKVKSGLWRMKVGQSRRPGEDLPAEGAAPPPPPPPPPAVADEDDEFAQFRAAATGEATPSTPPARQWTDADLSKLCNQGAVKDGNPERVKALIAEFVPEGEVQHSRNIPADQREAFAQKVEQTIGIQYAG